MNLRYISIFIAILMVVLFRLTTSAKWVNPKQIQEENYFLNFQDSSLKKTASLNLSPKLIAKLPEKIKETSGLLYFNQTLWTHNDGGNPPELYRISSANGKILQSKRISNAVNNDWEAMTQDSLHIYIGDFGNNSGDRTDLTILKIRKADLIDTVSDIVSASFIYIKYPDQVDFNTTVQQTEFDCEAFFYHEDSLHLFTKNWTSQTTNHFSVPVDSGSYKLHYRDTFQADGLITDASINNKGNIVLLGYKKNGRFWNCFCWLLTDYSGNNFFSGSKTRIELGSVLAISQAEAIIFNNDHTVLLSAERIFTPFFTLPAKLLKLDLFPALMNKR